MSRLTVALNDAMIWTIEGPAADEIGTLAFEPFPEGTSALVTAKEFIAAAMQVTSSDHLNAIIDRLAHGEVSRMVRLKWERG